MLKTIGKQLSYGLIAQIITFAITPIITRLYSPEEFGVFNNVVLWAGFLLPIIALSLPTAIVLQKSNAMAMRASRACMTISLIVAVGILLIIALLSISISVELSSHLLLATLLAIILNCNDIFAYTLIRCGKLRTRGVILLIQALITGLLKIALGLSIPTYSALVLATILGYVFCFLLFHKESSAVFKDFRIKDSTFLIKRYKEIVIFRMPQNLVTAANQLIPVFFITYYFGAVFAGLYALSRTVIVMPFTVLGRAVQDVLYPRYVTLIQKQKKISNEITKVVIFSLVLSTLPIIVLWLYGTEIFKIVFGEKWTESGVLAFWMIIPNVIMFSNKALIVLVSIFKIEKSLLMNSVFLLMLNLACYAILPQLGWSELDAVIYGSLLSTLPHFLLSYICLREVYKYENKRSSLRSL
ncbi:lipopolysaccharide biosynthesis protein [Vibrio alginolyticus]|uniref:lipopolysaccharide biosynthesis protein n=1 Tax=Vibrio alginolyticus TaxID=663 RepID=UPI00130398E6|nr:oligosaccharide flippase family protein [Vibrio alginolyticus]ELP9499539.1 oligosaccharide flippase family protein [Vibrio alginolyticus]